jgi:DNA-binding MarR family transcriptional regulator
VIFLKKKDSKILSTYNEDGFLQDIKEIETYVKTEKRHFKKGEFYMTSFDLDNLILNKEYSTPTMRVLVSLKTRLDYNNRIKTFRQSDVAEQAKTSQANVSRALKQLENDKIIIKDGLDYYFSGKFIKGAGDKNAKN